MEIATIEKVRDLRKRVLAGEDYTEDELREAIQALSGDRLAQLEKSANKKPRGKVAAKPVDLGDLL